jgi:hypothetical protein
VSIGETFNDFRRSTRLLLALSFAVGLLLLVGFTLTDLGINLTLWGWDPKPSWLKPSGDDGFHSHAYIPNVCAGLTGFLIGAPVALIVLATFTVQREEKSIRRAARSRAEAAWTLFSKAVADLCNDQRIWALTQGMEELEFVQTRSFKAANNYIMYLRRHDPHAVTYHAMVLGDSDVDIIPSDPEKLWKAMESITPDFENAFRAVMDRVQSDDDLELIWARAKGAWNVLDQYVRIQLIELSVPWFDSSIDAGLLKDMRREGNPIKGISDVLGEGRPRWVPPLNASGALETLQNNVMINRADLNVLLMSNTDFFGYNAVAFSPFAEEAAKFVRELRERVEQVNASGWPASVFGS